MNEKFDKNVLIEVQQFILKHTGILFDDDHLQDLNRHLTSVCSDLNIPLSSCIHYMKDSSLNNQFVDALVHHITIGETYFFRDKNLFLYLRDYLFPDLIQKRRSEGKLFIRIWSAACSSGEEPYSLAILLNHLLSDINSWDIYILGTDINQKMLERARVGIYSRWSFRDDPILPIGQYFTPYPDNRMKINESIKKMVRFERMNLIRDTHFFHGLGPSSLDIIFCRNVLMYFSKNQSRDVVSHLIYSLRTGGFLIVSPQEIGIVSGQKIQLLHHGSVFLHVKNSPKKIVPEKTLEMTPDLNTDISQFEIEPVNLEFQEEEISDVFRSVPDYDITDGVQPSNNHSLEEKNSFNSFFDENKLQETGIIIERNSIAQNRLALKQIEAIIREYAGAREYEKALGWSERLIAQDPLHPRAYLLKAAILDEQGLYVQSLQVLRQSLYANPDYLPAHLAIAGIYSKIGKPDLARHHYNIAVDILNLMDEDKVLEETEGISANKMKEMIHLLLKG